jgi:hypothetical protein
VKRLLVIALTFVVGAAAGVTASLIVFRPYGRDSLVIAIARTCGVRQAPKGDARCQEIVTTALDTWFLEWYDGDTPTIIGRD